MHWEEIKAMLDDQIERMMKLSERLGPTGRPLSRGDEELVRLAMLPRFKEHCQEATTAFLMADENFLKHTHEAMILLNNWNR